MATRRILVLSDHLMFAHGLESLLDQGNEFQIVGQETNIERAVEQVRALQPDIVIMDRSGLFKDSPELQRILEARSDVNVIGVSLHDNNLHIYKASQRPVEGVDDLIEVLSQI